jgi:hypothetical protein
MEPSVHRPKSQSFPEPEEKDRLWHLLGQCPPAEASGAFAANTLRTVRRDQARQADRTMPLIWWILAPAVCAVVIAGVSLTWHQLQTDTAEPEIAQETHEGELLSEELHLMTYVDELLTVSDPTTLDDDGLAELF